MSKTYKYFTKVTLLAAAIEARRSRRNRTLAIEKLQELPDHLVYPIQRHFLHNDVEIRCTIILSESKVVTLDVELEAFNMLPEVTPTKTV